MKYELQKILKEPRICLLLVALMLLNGIVFYSFCIDDSEGYTMAEIRDAYQNLDGLEVEHEKLREEVGSLPWDESTGARRRELYAKIDLIEAVWERTEPVKNYHDNRRARISESETKLKLGLFGDANSFSAKSIRRGVAEYQALENIQPQPVFLGGVEFLTNFRFTDVLLILFVLVPSMTLLTQEREAGLHLLTNTTKLGRSLYYFKKLLSGMILSTVGFILLYGSNLLITGHLLGYDHVFEPLQSLYGYDGSHLHMTVHEFLIQFLGMKYLWVLACLGVVFFICTCAGVSWIVVCGITGFAVVSFAMGMSGSLLLRNMSLWQLSNVSYVYQGAVYLNILGIPTEQGKFALLFLLITVVLSASVGYLIFKNTQKIQPVRIGGRFLRPGNHTNLFIHECIKALFMWKGLLILLIFLLVQVWTYSQYPGNYSEFEYYYHAYSMELEGLPSEEKKVYLETEQHRFETLHNQLVELARKYPDQSTFDYETREIQQMLRAEEAFVNAKQQYENLQTGQSYLYQTGYSKLYGRIAMQEDISNLGKAFLVMILLLSGFYAGERETGVQVLQISSKGYKGMMVSKLTIMMIYSLFVTLLAFLPKYLAVIDTYGNIDLTVQANSIQTMSSISNFWTVGGLDVSFWIIRYFISIVAGNVVCKISRKATSTVIAVLVSLSIVIVVVFVLSLSVEI